jgi:general secretion pathway protein C
MQDLIKRHFWVVGATVVMVCSVFAAKAVSHIAAKYLGDPEHAPHVTPMVAAPTAPKVTKSKDGGGLATRNIFCSECTPAVTVATNPNDIQLTSLPLMLLATNVGALPTESYATIINTENQRQGSFGVGDPIPGASGKVKEIHYKYVDFENNSHIERLVLQGQQAPVAPPVAVAEAGSGDGDDLQAAVNSGIKKIDETSYEIDKSLVDKVLANPMGVAKGARVVPAVQNGKPSGFKLYAIRPDSVYSKLGLTNGDQLTAINGMELTTADKALEVYTKLREATQLEVDIQRRGKPMTFKYSIR